MIQFGPIEKLGTIWWFEFFDLPEQKVNLLETRILEAMTEFEDNYSRFKEDSVLSQLNNDKCLDNPSGEFLEMLHIAKQAHKETGGVFNIAVGDYLEKSGYDAGYSFRSSDPENIFPLDKVLQVSPKQIKLLENVKVDFGGFGKGYLIDKLTNICKEEFDLQYFLINGGGDMFATSDHEEPIEIGLQDPQTKQIMGKYKLHNQAFAASSPILRQWTDQEGVVRDHLVSQEVTEKTNSYVVAPTATQADIWATTLAINNRTEVPETIHVFLNLS